MSRRAARFTQVDIRRAIEAAKAAGKDWAVEIAPDGTIRIVQSSPKPQQTPEIGQERRIVL
jgi:hypothetical protein